MNQTDIVLFQSSDGAVSLPISFDKTHEEVWLNRSQIAELYSRDVKTIGKHVNNALNEELLGMQDSTVAKFATVQIEGNREVARQIEHYNLDVVLSVGYRVKSQRGAEFRRWANDVLHRYLMQGRAENAKRLHQLNTITEIIERLPQELDSRQILHIIKSYMVALDLLDDYDHQTLQKPPGTYSTYVLSYEECFAVIRSMHYQAESNLFGQEKDDSFKSSIGTIYQSFDGEELYTSLEEKAANLLYFVTKNHSFVDGNKRIAAALFLYFLDKNGALFIKGAKRITDETLVAITIMIADSRTEDKESLISLVMNLLT
ncbi:MAG: type II toxin-antitoxin system death-on-curing family toxin [Eggerthellaceae bacterium]|nr:type II toxin-antitoxin system death-on-curing family toxin [Eggerthellaceae bacterium]